MKKILIFLLAGIISAGFAACSDDDETENPQETTTDIQQTDTEGQDVAQVVSSSESASFVRAGFTLTVPCGAVPLNSDGDEGKVAFSVARTQEMPAEIPTGTDIANQASIKVEPMNFTFSSPINITVPSQGCQMDKVALLRFNDYTEDWDIVPFSTLNTDGTASASILELGYFVLVEYQEQQTYGGIHIPNQYLDPNYYYYLTLTPTNTTNTDETIKRISFAPNNEDLYMTNIPLGTYQVTITRELRTSLGSSSSTREYSELGQITITATLQPAGNSYSTYTGWKELTPQDITWTDGRPEAWGNETVTYGTGYFQATLTWVNSSGSTTDYDLHLYGPDIHVYFANENDGAFELDRDWLHTIGNATENLYSINDNITAGEYQVKVHHYSGVTGKRYNCRVIMNGTVMVSTTGAISQNKQYDDIYSFTVE